MKDIPLSKIIPIEDTSLFKFHAARWNNYEHPLDVFIGDKKEWFGWNNWRNTKDEFSRDYIFSLIDFYPETDMWLFGGIYKVLKRKNVPKSHSYKISELSEFSSLVGRLKVKLPKPSRGRAFKLENYYNDMLISEILKEPYSGQVFPGYENINHDYHVLEHIFKTEKADWKSALENVKGVYLITDKSNGKSYVGAAYGSYGIWSRWASYIDSLHGNNDQLISLIKKKGKKHVKDNFKFSILELHATYVSDDFIISRETYWKDKLLTKLHGYNSN